MTSTIFGHFLPPSLVNLCQLSIPPTPQMMLTLLSNTSAVIVESGIKTHQVGSVKQNLTFGQFIKIILQNFRYFRAFVHVQALLRLFWEMMEKVRARRMYLSCTGTHTHILFYKSPQKVLCETVLLAPIVRCQTNYF